MRNRIQRTLVATLVAVAVAGPATAQAGTIAITDTPGGFNQLTLSAAYGENNDVWAGRRSSGEIWFEDVVPITEYPSLKCHYATALDLRRPYAVSCDPRNTVGIQLYLNTGENTASVFGGLPALISGVGASHNRFVGGDAPDVLISAGGDDYLSGGAANDVIQARGGADELHGGIGIDQLRGEDGPDTLEGGGQADVFEGGGGTDVVTYGNRSAPVNVSIDAYANDGGSHEGDYVKTDVENVEGGAGNDILGGGSADLRNALSGGPGNDKLSGGGGPDALYGSVGDDTFLGGPGSDSMTGGDGQDTVSYAAAGSAVTVDLDGSKGDDGTADDKDSVDADLEHIIGSPFGDRLIGNAVGNNIWGGGGGDLIEGAAGSDQLFGEAGEDRVLSADGLEDKVNCGAGKDAFDADAADLVAECESDQPGLGETLGETGQGGTGQGAGAARVRIGPARVRLTRRGVARLRVVCSAEVPQGCSGRLTLRRKLAGKPRAIGSRRFSVAAGRRGVVRVRVAHAVRQRVTGSGIRVRALVRTGDIASAGGTAGRVIRILPYSRSGRSG